MMHGCSWEVDWKLFYLISQICHSMSTTLLSSEHIPMDSFEVMGMTAGLFTVPVYPLLGSLHGLLLLVEGSLGLGQSCQQLILLGGNGLLLLLDDLCRIRSKLGLTFGHEGSLLPLSHVTVVLIHLIMETLQHMGL